MDSTKDHLEQRQTESGGISSDLRRLRTEGSASAAELREFLGQLRGRNPQEVLGAVAQSDLVRSIALATVGCVVLLAVATIIPYAMKDQSVVAEQPPSAATPVPSADATTEATPTAEPAVSSAEPDLERAADAMGISGSADADASSNPLEKKLDNLLDGVD